MVVLSVCSFICLCVVIIFVFYVFFLKHVNYYKYQILLQQATSCMLSFMKEIHRRQAFKMLAGNNTLLTKFHIRVLMTLLDREGIVSKNMCGNFDFFCLNLKSN